MSAPRDRAWIAEHLPHRDAMSLLEEIVAWDEESLHARATGHRRAYHPLRREGMLPVACAIEYGAQAVAAHGAIAAPPGAPPHAGYLAAVRSAAFAVERLDDIEAPLDVRVTRIGGAHSGMVYGFEVSAAGRMLARGRVTIMLETDRAAGALR